MGADGKWQVASASGAAEISITIKQPPSCKSYYIKYSGALLECGPALEGCHCDMFEAFIDVSVWRAEPACPPVAPGAGGWGSLLGEIQELVFDGYTHYVECNKPVDVTEDELPEDERKRRTARIHRCSDPDSGGGIAGPPEYIVEGDSLYAAFDERPDSEAILSVLEGAGVLAGVTEIEGLQDFLELRASVDDEDRPLMLDELVSRFPTLAGVDVLTCGVDSTYFMPLPGGGFSELDRSHTLHLSLRSNGDFTAEKQLDLGVVDGVRESILLRWAGLGGDVYYKQDGDVMGMIYPAKNGAAASARASELWALSEIMSWLDNPFQLADGGGFIYDIQPLPDGRTKIERYVDWTPSGDPGADSIAASLLGGVWSATLFEVDGVVRLERLQLKGTTGQVVRDTHFTGWSEVLPGIERPRIWTVLEYRGDGTLRSTTAFRLDGGTFSPADLGAIRPPGSADARWLVQVQ
mgnify:CR=1 FL=1